MPFLLTIRERNYSWAGRSPVTSTHEKRAAAEAALADYVRLNWKSEMDSDELPEDSAEMVEQYFSEVLESYAITQQAMP